MKESTFESPEELEQRVRSVLSEVIDPELGMNIVDLGMLKRVDTTPSGVEVEVALTVSGCPLRNQIRSDIEHKIKGELGLKNVVVVFSTMKEAEKASLMQKVRLRRRETAPPPPFDPQTPVLAIASGKGGVGKSTITANLAIAFAKEGMTVGVIDADIAGFSLPRLMGISGKLTAKNKKILPIESREGAGALKVVSMGLIVEQDAAVLWRGLLLGKAFEQFLHDVNWGSVDLLVVDMPPGTSDVGLALARLLPRSQILVVTTPPTASLEVAGRIAEMAKKASLRIAGVVENMSYFICDHGAEYHIFGEGGGLQLANKLGTKLLARIPMFADLSSLQDKGVPVAKVEAHPGSQMFKDLAGVIAEELSLSRDLSSCSARQEDAALKTN